MQLGQTGSKSGIFVTTAYSGMFKQVLIVNQRKFLTCASLSKGIRIEGANHNFGVDSKVGTAFCATHYILVLRWEFD
jgi:hypothetical protein